MNFNKEVQKSFVTIGQMLADRGVDTTSLGAVSPEDIVAISASRNIFNVDLPSCNYRIIWSMNPKFKLADVRKLLEEDLGQAAVYMVVARDKPTHAALKGVEDLSKDVQFFDIRELQFNVSRHTLVPRHEPIRDEAHINEIMSRYRVKSRLQLPLILSTDPMARYLALKPGQLVRITRVSPSAGSYVLYRCCMKAA
jgi:DNA-directed RNA polymerase subunit H (RpoH/RPB5)